MRLGPVIERLDVLDLRQVDGALAFADIANVLKALPAAFVVPTTERAGENRLVGAHDQRVSVSFSVVLVLAAAARAKSQIPEDLHDRTAAVIGRLAAWTHPDMIQATDYAGGRLLNVTGGRLFWQLDFTTAYRLRKV